MQIANKDYINWFQGKKSIKNEKNDSTRTIKKYLNSPAIPSLMKKKIPAESTKLNIKKCSIH